MTTQYQMTDDVTGSTVTIDGKSTTVVQTETIQLSGSATHNATLTLDGSNWVAFKFTTPANATSLTWETASGWFTAATNTTDTTASFSMRIYNDSAGLPGTLNTVWGARISGGKTFTTTGTPTQVEITKSPGWSPSNNTAYWLAFEFDTGPASGTYAVAYDNTTGANIVATSANSGSTWGAIAGTGYYQLGDGGGHAVVANSYAGHAIDAKSVNGIAVYGEGTGPASYAGYFKADAGANGVYVNANSGGALTPLRVDGTNGSMIVDTNGVTQMHGIAFDVLSTGNSTTLTASSPGTIFVQASSKTITLPDPLAANGTPTGRRFTICNQNFTGTTVATAGGSTISGSATDTTSLASAWAFATYQTDGVAWYRVG